MPEFQWGYGTYLLACSEAHLHQALSQSRPPDVLRQALLDLAHDCDVVVSTGGVSAGDTDWIRPLVAELGAVDFWKLFLRPGRPFAFGSIQCPPAVGSNL